MSDAEMKAAFVAQRNNAKQRGIAFEFDFEDWCAWWLEDGRWHRRKADRLCMARNGDCGPYAPANVYCSTTAQNTKDYWKKNPGSYPEKMLIRLPEGWRERIEALRLPGEQLADTQRRVIDMGLEVLKREKGE